MKETDPRYRPLISYKLHGSLWDSKCHRYVVRNRSVENHSAGRKFRCHTASHAAALYNAMVRAFRGGTGNCPLLNDFQALFRVNRYFEGPHGSGSRIIMMEPPFCWVKISEGMDWLAHDEWFIDPVTEKPTKTVLVKSPAGQWEWVNQAMDEILWERRAGDGHPRHVNGDQLDCRWENLVSENAPNPSSMTRPASFSPLKGIEQIAYALLSRCWVEVLSHGIEKAIDPWEPAEVDMIDLRPVPRHPFQERDRRWLIELCRKYVPELLEVPLWRERAEEIRLLSRPWKISWGTRKSRSASSQ